MYIAVPLIFLLVLVAFVILIATGVIVLSGTTPNPEPRNIVKFPVKEFSNCITNSQSGQTSEAVKKAYIDLGGRLIELNSKAEEAVMKKQGFKVVYK